MIYPDSEHTSIAAEIRSNPGRRGRLMRLATYASVVTACTLIGVKLAAWIITDSVALLSTLIDSVLDAAASIVTLFAVRHALTPADEDHRFGHGKAEPLASLMQAAFICGSGLFLFLEALPRFADPVPVSREDIGIAVMIFSIVLTGLLVTFQRWVVRATGSMAVNADSAHYVGDVLINMSVIVSLLLATQADLPMADPIFAIAIAGYLMWTAKGIGMQAYDMLMDREMPEEERAKIHELALSHAQVIGCHDLRTRMSGPNTFIQMHLEMDGEMTLADAHAVVIEVERSILRAYPDAEILIHQDPEGGTDIHHPDRINSEPPMREVSKRSDEKNKA